MIIKYFRNIFLLLLICSTVGSSFSQNEQSEPVDSIEAAQYETFLKVIESSIIEYYSEFASNKAQEDSIKAAFGYDYKDVPEFSDSVYCARLNEMNKTSPFHLDCNEAVLKNIKFFAEKRRNFASVTLGRSKLYFNMYEEVLAKHNLPIELKYLSVIESGLRPTVKSRAGALGLWQFMYRTGKAFGLDQNSYVDERMDPILATEAAAKYLKYLYGLYEDWNLALAAYNAGPGNVNKAIRRSGGKMTYWEIRPFLPRETQGYVPNFIAMAYLMTYYAEHNIEPREAKFHDFDVDTVCLKGSLNMAVIDSLIKWPVEDIQALNPVFKTTFIPETERHSCINIPTKYLNEWIAMEDSIYVLDSVLYHIEKVKEEEIAEQSRIVHSVRQGQTLSHIASRYGTTVRSIMDWNNLRSTRLSIGQRLVIYSASSLNSNNSQQRSQTTTSTTASTSSGSESSDKKIYVVNPGDSLWAIARENDTTVDALKELNPDVNHSDLKVGQKIRIR